MTLRRLEVVLDSVPRYRKTEVEEGERLQVEVCAEGLEAGVSLSLS
jgi:hypothetical protein